MGKGTIVSGGTGGLYSVTLELKRDNVTAELARLAEQISILTTKAAGMEAGYEKNLVLLQVTVCEKRTEYLNQQMPVDPTVSAWCADKTENLSGSVGTIEVPGERGTVLVQPGYGGNATYSAARDGQLSPIMAQNAAGAYFNLAMMPGWQKWKPTYRFGTISNLNKIANTCTVTLDAAASSQQELNVNQSTTLNNVPIAYMACNAGAFENGDDVLVKFTGQDFAQPVVIGFEENPKPCYFQFRLTRDDGTLITPALNPTFDVYRSNEDIVETTPSYDAATGYWSLVFDAPETTDPNGYWVEYDCDGSLPTQYPYRWQLATQWQADNLTPIGKYTDNVPTWIVTYPDFSGSTTYDFGQHIWNCWNDFPWAEGYDFARVQNPYQLSEIKYYSVPNVVAKTINVVSSVPFTYSERLFLITTADRVRQHYKYMGHVWCADPLEQLCTSEHQIVALDGEFIHATWENEHAAEADSAIYPAGTYSLALTLTIPAGADKMLDAGCSTGPPEAPVWNPQPTMGTFLCYSFTYSFANSATPNT